MGSGWIPYEVSDLQISVLPGPSFRLRYHFVTAARDIGRVSTFAKAMADTSSNRSVIRPAYRRDKK